MFWLACANASELIFFFFFRLPLPPAPEMEPLAAEEGAPATATFFSLLAAPVFTTFATAAWRGAEFPVGPLGFC